MNIGEKFNINNCSGCSACHDVCPCGAIEMVYGRSTYHLIPKVDVSKCKNCSACINVCPIINQKPKSAFKPYGFAAVANDSIRKISSSGGMFLSIAEYVLEKNGYVAGVVFDDKLKLIHVISNDYETIKKMCGSKYIRDDASNIYKKVKELLDLETLVFFTGTPCQVYGLKRFLKREYNNLITVDIFCHGVPSQYIFDHYIDENFNKADIADVIFRNKNHLNGHPGSLTIKFKNGKELFSEYFDNSYYDGFLRNLTIRSSCLKCQFAEFERIGDLSIGDFWGAKETDTKIDYRKGCSVAIINTKKGENIWQKLSSKLEKIESYDLITLLKWNRNKISLKAHKNYHNFPSYFRKYNSLKESVDKLLDEKFKVGIFGILSNPNYGGQITYYALYKTIEKMGYSVSFINKPYKDSWPNFVDITSNLCHITDRAGIENLEKYNSKFDVFLLGSDQTWNYGLFKSWGSSLYFDFVRDDKVKLAYASSFGHNFHKVPSDKIGEISSLFKRFNAISVREKDGTQILKNKYNVESEHVLDPVFLANKDEYVRLSNFSKLNLKNKHYIGTYIMSPSDFRLGVVQQISQNLNKKCINITDGTPNVFDEKNKTFKEKNMEAVPNANIYDWLKMIINADFVITDSYHASCFSIIFNKPFILLQSGWALSRIESLFGDYDLNYRWIRTNNINEFKINKRWFNSLSNKLYKKLNKQIEESYNWLKNNIETPKQINIANCFVPLNNKNRVEDYFFFMTKNKSDYILVCSTTSADTKILKSIDFKCNLTYKNFKVNENMPYLFIHDYAKNIFIEKSGNYIEQKYSYDGSEMVVLLNNQSKKINNIYVKDKDFRSVTNLNPDSHLCLSIFSKSKKRIVDAFDVFLSDGVPFLKRR